MYLINREQNKISKLEEKTFSDLGFKEKEHLQEWLADNPKALGEDLLIIQKEFSGFMDTNERLDLLALDKQGNIVVIENKLDDSGKDVTGQVLKYASYCSSLSKEHIRNIYQEFLNRSGVSISAEEKLSEFFDGVDFDELSLNQGAKQRIAIVAGKFRKEVTSTVLWLMNYKIRIQCFKVTPFALDDQLFLNLEQILPIKDTDYFSISMADKTQDDISSQETLKSRHHTRLDFWNSFLLESNKSNSLYRNISPSKDSYLQLGIGLGGVTINIVVSKLYARCEVNINRGNQQENKDIFDQFLNQKKAIEDAFYDQLIWERMDDKVSSRIKFQLNDVSVFEKSDWPQMIQFLINASERMNHAFKNPMRNLKNYLSHKKNGH
ncbi:MAG: DUF4268 domain-containing protein [Hyphomicrobiales bacterium]